MKRIKFRIIENVNELRSLLPEIQKLADSDKEALGFLPAAALSDAIDRKRIMAIVNGSDRAKGSHDALEACGMKIVAEQTAEWDNAKGQAVTENILTAHPKLEALFASNDNMAMGAIEALKSAKMLDKVTVVGFDGNPEAAAAILKGEMAISIAQRPPTIRC